MATIVVKTEINSSLDKVWKIVSDIDNEPKFWKGTKEVKTLSEAREQEKKDGKNPLTFVTQESAFKDKASEELNIIIKSDVHGSSEAIKSAINQFKHNEVKPKIILSDIGMVTETDVSLAKASKAILIAFNVKPSKEAKKMAEKEKITISSSSKSLLSITLRYSSIILNLLEASTLVFSMSMPS